MRPIAIALALCLPLGRALPAQARDEGAGLRAVGRAVLARHGAAVVTVRLAVKTRVVFEGRESSSPDSTLEVPGTVLSPDGLTAVSDFTTNPTALYQRGDEGPEIETETSDVKLVLADGRELPARFVLRDRDLDLAFVAPIEPVRGLPFVRLEPGTTPAPLDDLLFVSQLARAFNRAPAVSQGQVRAVVTRPRTFVVPGALEGLLALGGPAFDARGRAVGLVVLRRVPGGDPQRGLRDLLEDTPAAILGAADVLEVAAQAAAARAAHPKDPATVD